MGAGQGPPPPPGAARDMRVRACFTRLCSISDGWRVHIFLYVWSIDHSFIRFDPPTLYSCIDRHHKAAAARALPTPPPQQPPPPPRFLPPGSPAEEAAAQDGMGPAATLFMASDELLPVVEYVIALVRPSRCSCEMKCSWLLLLLLLGRGGHAH